MFEIIKKLCAEKNIPVSKLEQDLGFPRSYIQKWKHNTPSIDKAQKVADYFGVTLDYLIGATDDPHSYKEITEEEKQFYETYMKMKQSDKATVKGLMKIVDKLLGVDEEEIS